MAYHSKARNGFLQQFYVDVQLHSKPNRNLCNTINQWPSPSALPFEHVPVPNPGEKRALRTQPFQIIQKNGIVQGSSNYDPWAKYGLWAGYGPPTQCIWPMEWWDLALPRPLPLSSQPLLVWLACSGWRAWGGGALPTARLFCPHCPSSSHRPYIPTSSCTSHFQPHFCSLHCGFPQR